MKKNSKYKDLSDWRKHCPKDYSSAKRQGYIEEICNIFGWRMFCKNPSGYWNKKRCIEEARKYYKIVDWKTSSVASYNAAKRNGWYEECIAHMKIKHRKSSNSKPRGYWSKYKNVLNSAKKIGSDKTWIDWKTKFSGAYNSALKNGWLEGIKVKMGWDKKKPSKEDCLNESRKHNSVTSWKNADKETYYAAIGETWYPECIAHIKYLKKRMPRGHWNIKTIIESIGNNTTIARWQKNASGAFDASRKFGIVDKCREIIRNNKKEFDKLKKEKLEKERNKLKEEKKQKKINEVRLKIDKIIKELNTFSITEWRKKDSGRSYNQAKYYDILDEIIEKYELKNTILQ